MTPELESLMRATTAMQVAIYEAIDGELPDKLLRRTLLHHQNTLTERIAAVLSARKPT